MFFFGKFTVVRVEEVNIQGGGFFCFFLSYLG